MNSSNSSNGNSNIHNNNSLYNSNKGNNWILFKFNLN